MKARSYRYDKECECWPATASTGALRLRQEMIHGEFLVVFTLIPGPSCDVCGKPWRITVLAGSPATENDSELRPVLPSE